MKRYSTAAAKQRLTLLLDAAERGEQVVIERRGVCFRLQPERRPSRKTIPRQSIIEIVDPVVAEGNWQWNWTSDGLRFATIEQNRH